MIVSGLMALALLTGGANGPDKSAPVKYKVTLNVSQSLDTGEQQMASTLSSVAFIAVSMSDTTGGQIANIVVDSVAFAVEGMFAQQFPGVETTTAAAAGGSVRVYIVNGKVSGAPQWSTEDNPVLSTVASAALGSLFIGLAPSRAVGDNWADTTSVAAEASPNGLGTSQVITWVVSGSNESGLVVEGSSTGTIAGSPQGAEIAGTIIGTVAVTSPAGGPAHTAKLTNTQKVEVLAPGASGVMTVDVQNSVTLELIP